MRCLKCGKLLDDETKPLCRACEEKERFFDRGFALMEHDAAAKNIIYGFKFRYELDNIRFPALEAAIRYGRELLRLNTEAFIPVPLHKSRYRERGYNQAQLLAQKISEYMKLIYDEAPGCDASYLLRKEKTKHQMDLDRRFREENVRSAFCINPEAERSYKSVCIVDDIYTTGATVNFCAKTLKLAGCEKVYFIAVSTVG